MMRADSIRQTASTVRCTSAVPMSGRNRVKHCAQHDPYPADRSKKLERTSAGEYPELPEPVRTGSQSGAFTDFLTVASGIPLPVTPGTPAPQIRPSPTAEAGNANHISMAPESCSAARHVRIRFRPGDGARCRTSV